MIVLADENNTIWARGENNVTEAMEKLSRWGGDEKTLRQEWVPDDTRFERRPEGGFTISADQPDGWNTRRQEQAQTYDFMVESQELLKNTTIPDSLNDTQTATYMKEIRKILLGHHLIIRKLMKAVRNG